MGCNLKSSGAAPAGVCGGKCTGLAKGVGYLIFYKYDLDGLML